MSDYVATCLDEICTIIMGQSPPSSAYNTKEKGLPFFQGKAEFTELHPVAVKWCTESKKIAEANDILLSVRAPVGTTNIADQKCCIGRGLAALRYVHCYKFLFYYLRFIEKKLDEKGTGTTFRAVSGDVVRNYPINLPPLPEQRAIVAKIEQLFSELDNGISCLKKAQEQLKVYRQAVLKQAFEGELTKPWREQQANLPSAQELLDKIRTEREQTAKNQGKKLKPVTPLSQDELDDLPELPEGWVWVKYEEIGYWSGGGTPSKNNMTYWQGGDVLWVSPKDMKVRTIVDTIDKITSISISQSSVKLIQPNSILFVVRSGIIRRTLPISIAGKELTVNQDLQALTLYYGDFKFIYWYSIANEQLIRSICAKDGTTVDNLEVTMLKNFPVSFCSDREQAQIVQEIETRLSVCDNMEATIKESLEKADALRQSILKKAFEGKLLSEAELQQTRNDPDWEPAEKLLEHIRAEKINRSNKH